MYGWVIFSGSVLNVVGAILIALGDTWFSRSVLIYLDALEGSLSKVVDMLRSGGKDFIALEINPQRDRGQDRARSVKLVGWCVLTVGLVVQLIGSCLAMTANVPAR
jgi:hypothetical protein